MRRGHLWETSNCTRLTVAALPAVPKCIGTPNQSTQHLSLNLFQGAVHRCQHASILALPFHHYTNPLWATVTAQGAGLTTLGNISVGLIPQATQSRLGNVDG
jgi:hypothetical protein